MSRLLLTLLLSLARRYPLVRGRDFFFRHFVRGKPLQAQLAQLPNPSVTRRGFSIYCNPSDYTSDWIKFWGEHETITETFLLRHLRHGGAFLDVGANVGYFSLLAAHVFREKCHVTAFEPNPSIAALLRQSVEKNSGQNRIRVIEAAVSDAPGELQLVIDRDNTGHSFLGATAGSGPRVAVIRIDDWLQSNPPPERITAIKLDVEGCELNALRGMEATLRTHRPALVVEVIDHHLRQFGASRDELLTFVKNLGFVEEMTSRDDNLYFVPSN